MNVRMLMRTCKHKKFKPLTLPSSKTTNFKQISNDFFELDV